MAAHLLTAFFLFAYIWHLALTLGWPSGNKIRVPYYKQTLNVLLLLIAIQLLFGAFVAGLKAGFFYTTFPTMNGAWLPTIISENYASTGVLSLIDTVAGVQFVHRWLGVGIWAATLAIGVVFGPSLANKLRRSFLILFVAISIQAVLGIFTLLYAVPITLAVFHQFGALLTLMAWVYAKHVTSLK